LGARAKEVVESDLEQRSRRGVRGDVPSKSGLVPIGAHDHGHGIPTDDALDAALDLTTPRVGWLLPRGNRIDVRRGHRRQRRDAGLLRPYLEAPQESPDPLRVPLLKDKVE